MERGDLKPLYLCGAQPLEVALDGPALCVDSAEQASRLFPLRRISRVIVSGEVRWSTEALLACAEHGITITFLDAEGAVRARWIGRVTERSGLRQRLDDLFDRPDGHKLYADWRHAMEQQAALAALKALDLDLREAADLSRLRALVNRAAEKLADPMTARRMARLHRGMLTAQVTELLHEAGLLGESDPAPRSVPHLAGDLTRILAWRLEPIRLGWLHRRQRWAARRRQPIKAPHDHQLIRLYQSRAARLDQEGRVLLARLHRFLSEIP